MLIIVNDIAAVPNSGGVFSVLEDFYKEIVNSEDDNDWIFLLADKYFPETKRVKILTFHDIKTNWFKRLSFELVTGRKIINRLHPDIYFSLQNTMTLGIAASKKVAYVHQPLFFQKDILFSFFKKKEVSLAIHQRLIGRFINFTLRKEKPIVIVQTKWMKDAIVSYKVLPEEKVLIVPPKKIAMPNKGIINLENEFFFPSIVRSYKNHIIIFKAVELLQKEGMYKYRVNITGKPEEFDVLSSNLAKQIHFMGTIERKLVFKEYEKSVLIFPSLMETYGLPLLEAKMVGTIIFAADLPYAHEVLGGYTNAYYFDPKDPEKLKVLMKQYLNGEIKLKRIYKENSNDTEFSLRKIILQEE